MYKINKEIVSWISVYSTNINYPIVKSDNNEFYLNHNINKSYDSSGWTFMDYRNNSDLSDFNTIFYGHNLINKTCVKPLILSFVKNCKHFICAIPIFTITA